ncbi:transglutaminase domain-containing protein [Candidatus Woesearchaeota archaeon]|jgi:transglutaminase-like putative cysteine protease|nr:transglutaminase domain-containing protein [Candidatus Woesearchaeota archaeon]
MKIIKKYIIFAFFLIFISNVAASNTPYENWNIVSDSLLLDFKVKTDITVEPKSNDFLIKNINLSLSFFPRNDYRQDNVVFQVTPTDYQKGENLIFNWQDPQKDKYQVKIDSNIRTINIPKKIEEKIKFPIATIPEEYKLYLEETELMDYNNEAIIELATELAEGEDDLYETVFKIATWTNENINYSLDTLTADASLPASWVLENRRGVCDELTNLFISLVRTLNIPAKFVAGISYTESELFTENWGTHGWAEIYFPSYGWVPFDVTYGQMGIIDPTHIKLKESFDSDKTSTSFEWLGHEVGISSSGIKMDTEIIDYGNQMSERVKITNSLTKEMVGFGSYNLLHARIKNLNNYYLPIRISVSKTQPINGINPLEIIDPLNKYVLLKPNEEKTVYWRVKIAKDLPKINVYTFPILVYTSFNETSMINLKAKFGETTLSHKDVQELLEALTQKEQKVYSKKISMNCNSERKNYYISEDVNIKCSLKNNGNTNIKELDVCYDSDCKKIELKISQQREITFTKQKKEGSYDAVITAKNNEISKTATVEFIVEEKPVLKIKETIFPETIIFSKPFDIKFTVEKQSSSSPINISIKLFYNFGHEEWKMETFTQDRDFEITIPGYQLASKTNEFKILVEYYDKDNTRYEVEDILKIEVKDLTIKDKAILYFNRINSDSKLAGIIGGVIIGLIILFGIINIVNKKKK